MFKELPSSSEILVREWKTRIIMAGVTQADIAKALRMTDSKLSKILNGWIKPTPREQEELERVLDSLVDMTAVEQGIGTTKGENPLWDRVLDAVRLGYDKELARLMGLVDILETKRAADLEDIGRALAVQWFRDNTKEEIAKKLKERLDEL